MAEDLQELVISLRADVQGLKASLSAAKSETEAFSKGMSHILGELQKSMIEVFAIAKVVEFFKEGIERFASFDQALEQTIQNIERFDKTATASKEGIAEWGEVIEKTTLFTKDQAVESLNKLVTMTGNFADSQRLAKTAMDFATVAHVDLESATKALGNAYEGNNTAVRALTRNMPELAKALKDGKDIFVALREQGINGASEAIGNKGLAGGLDKAKKLLEDLGEKIGAALEGPLKMFVANLGMLLTSLGFVVDLIGLLLNGLIDLGKFLGEKFLGWFKDLLEYFVGTEKAGTLFNEMMSHMRDMLWGLKNPMEILKIDARLLWEIIKISWSGIMEATRLLGNVIEAQFRGIGKAMKFDFAGVKEAYQDAAKNVVAIGELGIESDRKIIGAVKGAMDAIHQAATKGSEAMEGFTGKAKPAIGLLEHLAKTVTSFQEAFKKEMEVEQMSVSEALKLYNKAGEEFTITLDKNSKTYQKDKEAFEKMVKDREEKVKKAAKVIAEALKDVAKAIGGAIESSFSKMAADVVKGTFNIGQAFEMLGKSIVKSMVGAIAEVLIKMGESDLAEGAGNLFIPEKAVTAPGYFASGAYKVAAGGTIKGFAEAALAEGGIVTKPTVALIGEAGPEKVIPLNRAGADSSGGIHINGPVHLPNVRDPRQFITELQRMKARAGYRYTSF